MRLRLKPTVGAALGLWMSSAAGYAEEAGAGRPTWSTLSTGFSVVAPNSGWSADRGSHGKAWTEVGHSKRVFRSARAPEIYLDRRWSGRGANVVVVQQIISVAPVPFIPSVRELPTLAGIRDATPDEPIAVLATERGLSGGLPRVGSRVGPKIITIDARSTEPELGSGGGARIVELRARSAQ